VQTFDKNQATFEIDGTVTRKKPVKWDFSSEIVKVGKTLTKHLRGAEKIFAVVYISSPTEILRLFEEGVSELHLVVGHKRVHNFREELTPDTVEKLINLRNDGKLSLYVSDKIHYHSKLYICEFENRCKLINGSANLTKTGTGIKGNQWNHIWVFDIEGNYQENDKYLTEKSHFENYKRNTEEFFGEFGDAFDNIDPEKKIDVIQNWIASGDVYGLPDETQMKQVTRLIVDEVMNPNISPDQTVVTIMPNASNSVLEKVSNSYAPIGITIENEGTIIVPRGKYLDHNNRNFPQMKVNLDQRSVYLGWGGKLLNRTATEYDADEIRKSLEMTEDFVRSVLIADPEFPKLAMKSVAEAILYILSTPFHSEYMRLRREVFGITEERGPRVLHLYGETSNGKSKLLTYCSKLLTGNEIVSPMDGDGFTQTEVTNLRSWQSTFPMMWDDLTNDKWTKGKDAEKVIKTYWDKRWTQEDDYPQLVLTSNKQCPRGPLQTRVKEIHLSSTFPRSTESRVELARHLNSENPLFEYLSKACIEYMIENPTDYDDDEAFIVRKALKKLYKIANRTPPDWMPLDGSLEELYNPTSVQILKAMIDGICTIEKGHGEMVLKFKDDMQWFELNPYVEGIPNEFNVQRKGVRIFIRRPDRFVPWLKEAYAWVGKVPLRIRWKLR